MDRIELLILRSLMFDDPYTRRVLPFIEPTYFLDKTERTIFLTFKSFIDKFNTLPTKEAVIIDLNNSFGTDQDDIDEMVALLNIFEEAKDDKPDSNWLVERTEEWCQEKAVHNAVLQVITILEGKDKKSKGNIPKLLNDALAISFDPHVGHDYLEDAASRYDFYHKKESRLPFHLDMFNQITNGGVPNKTLNICLAGTGVGKSLFMCDLGAAYLLNGKNVLYITMEMAEERIAERIDANLMDRALDDLKAVSKDTFQKAIDRIHGKTKGRLIIKEYPTASAHVGHFRFLINELNLKKQFKPDVIFIDYLNICASTRVKNNSSGGLYEVVKGIAEELRGLAVEFTVPIWSATQMNRAGFNNNDPDLTNTSESFGLPATADFMFALVVDEKLQTMNQLLVKILKNRYGDVNMRNKETGAILSRFVVGIDRSKMKLYNLDASHQNLNSLDDANGPAPAPYGGGQGKPSQRPPQRSPQRPVPNRTPTPQAPASSSLPWEDNSNTETLFDIDLPPDQQPFNEADEEANRRKAGMTPASQTYQPGSTSAYTNAKATKKQLKNIGNGSL